MKIFTYSYRADEVEFFKTFSKKYEVEIQYCKEAPTPQNAGLAKGFDCISIITTPVDRGLVDLFFSLGVKFISTRTVGYEHIDTARAAELGMGVGNVSYSPNSVADYTIMLILMATRKMRSIMERAHVQDYSLKRVRGIELQKLTVGVIGTGRIGQTVIQHLSGFGTNIIAYDPHPVDFLSEQGIYRTMEEVLEQSNIITLHVPSTEENFHLINKDTISRMKNDVYIINTARGTLIDHEDLISGIENRKIAGAALDVIEEESDLFYQDLKCEIISHRQLAVLKSFPNVIITPHTAFYTDQAVSDMVENSIRSCMEFIKNRIE